MISQCSRQGMHVDLCLLLHELSSIPCYTERVNLSLKRCIGLGGKLSNPNTNKARTFRWQETLRACESGGSCNTSAAAHRRAAPRGT